MGLFASFILLNKDLAQQKKVNYLIVLGASLLLVGLGWSFSMPIIKKIWSSTYVLVAGGLSFLLMGLLYWIIDVKKYQKWTLIFVWIGVNPITIYMARKLIDFNGLAKRFTGGTTDLHSPNEVGYLFTMVVSLLLSLVLLRYLYNKKLFLKV
jgi:predicted acyltransferase